MKNIILLLGFIVSASLTGVQISNPATDASETALNPSRNEFLISLNYTGRNEDGETEGVDTGSQGR